MHCNRSSDQNLYGEMGHQTSAPFFLTRRLGQCGVDEDGVDGDEAEGGGRVDRGMDSPNDAIS